MSRVAAVDERYRATEAVVRGGVILCVVADAPGMRLNDSIRRITRTALEDGSGLWENLLGAAKSLRWRTVFRPQPLEFNPSITLASLAVLRQADALEPALGREGAALLAALVAAVGDVGSCDPPVGSPLLEAIQETGPADCLIMTDGTLSRHEVESWLGPMGFRVLSPGMLTDSDVMADVTYIVGPPRLMRTSLVTAPPTPEVSFFVPSWFTDLALPTTAVAPFAEGAIQPKVRIFRIGEVVTGEPTVGYSEPDQFEDFAPPPLWGVRSSATREPGVDEVTVRKVLLSGGFAIWMDDGDRIRTLDPSQPTGERVTYTDVSAVQGGTYLVLRLGSTERAALYEQTLRSMGEHGAVVKQSQETWKQELFERLKRLGRRFTESRLHQLGVNAFEQAVAWTEPTLARPQRDGDFVRLLEWLGLPNEPTFTNATDFRRARSRAAMRIREQLERAMSRADLEMLRRDGHVKLDGEGFAGIIATRVLAISPHTNIVARHEAREPFLDDGGQWLE